MGDLKVVDDYIDLDADNTLALSTYLMNTTMVEINSTTSFSMEIRDIPMNFNATMLDHPIVTNYTSNESNLTPICNIY